ncbi:hypothetical protein A3E15_03150 [Candidatus Woesebacteria bacterium RIFCSPHIGHO2_12_FULL_42_9]|uniref:HD domain-containing protein n=2 Tax=Candidatus Woeseibacteriota TaxID=1752722 RepID=A0A1F8AWL2_9BACT|nr:MAG: hypothetical protein A2129_01850 [Candidatus Woesebacteria bacterium GWC1_42_13]OGM56122.1 MAG: hypothetical protein A3E15_03150 [Candidatus Woesebacteria bacterium RIFCSPHIGHO2_12_FULL_42_9]
MCAETIHQDTEFQRRRRAYFQDFMIRHRPQARIYKEKGLLNEEGSKGWRNVARHQLLSAVMTETVLELLGMPRDESERLINLSLTHDVDKRRQQESLSREGVISDELNKSQRPLVATSTNFIGFSDWELPEFILRYVDSSIGENPKQSSAGHWYGVRDPKSLPEVVILPWRQRVQMFKANKADEGEKGMPLYGMTTWDKLEQIMVTIESDLFRRIIEKNPNLAKKYTTPSQLTGLIEDRIHEKILNS